jgi:hypothetical protein
MSALPGSGLSGRWRFGVGTGVVGGVEDVGGSEDA